MNEVRVSSPYLAESVSGGTPAANERVKKVVRLFTGLKFHFSWIFYMGPHLYIYFCFPA